MQTLVAYVALSPLDGLALAAGKARVERAYARSWPGGTAVQEAHLGEALAHGAGLCSWDVGPPASRWPSFAQCPDLTVASVYLPLGYEQVVGEVDPVEAPVALTRVLIEAPERMSEIAAPFALAALDSRRGRLHVLNDALGLGRLFQCRAPFGWVWSNRPAAALAFAGLSARPDDVGWQMFATAGWFMAEATPFEGVSAAPPGFHARYDEGQRRVTITHKPWALMPQWSAEHADDPIEEAAFGLQQSARWIARNYLETPTLDLSGGRDSRLVCAAFLSAGVDVRVQTNGSIPGEADTARRLIASYPGPVDHRVEHPRPAAARGSQLGLFARGVGWHQYAEGLRMSSYLASQPPGRPFTARGLTVGGAGGEVAHGHYYPSNLTELLAGPDVSLRRRIAAALSAQISARFGPTTQGRAQVAATVDGVIGEGLMAGVRGAELFDWFYLRERLRRWGTTAERAGVVSPLLAPVFLRTALAMTPERRRQNQLHRRLIARLVPAWADVPFFTPGPQDLQAAARPRVWQPPERSHMQRMLEDTALWGDYFDRPTVAAMWERASQDKASAADEVVLHRIAWLCTFHAYLAILNGEDETSAIDRQAIAPALPAVPLQREPRTRSPRHEAARILHGLARRIDRVN